MKKEEAIFGIVIEVVCCDQVSGFKSWDVIYCRFSVLNHCKFMKFHDF